MSSGQGQAPTGQYCSQCAHPLHPDDEFCGKCGTHVVGATTAQTPAGGSLPTYSGPVPPPPGAAYPPATPVPPSSQPMPFAGTPPPAPEESGTDWRRHAPWIAVAVLAVAAIAGGLVFFLRDSGDDSPAAQPEAPSTTVVEAPLTADQPVSVSLGDDTETARAHSVPLTSGQQATVFVSAGRRFTPDVVVLDGNGAPVASDAVALGRRGAAVNFTAGSGQHVVAVAGFTPSLSEYTVEYQPNVRFMPPEEIPVGDCVNRWGDQPWRSVNGFVAVGCSQPHEGQVFEQVAGFGGQGTQADERCDEARSERVSLPGYVSWWSFWGTDLTCVLVGANGSTLDRSLVNT